MPAFVPKMPTPAACCRAWTTRRCPAAARAGRTPAALSDDAVRDELDEKARPRMMVSVSVCLWWRCDWCGLSHQVRASTLIPIVTSCLGDCAIAIIDPGGEMGGSSQGFSHFSIFDQPNSCQCGQFPLHCPHVSHHPTGTTSADTACSRTSPAPPPAASMARPL